MIFNDYQEHLSNFHHYFLYYTLFDKNNCIKTKNLSIYDILIRLHHQINLFFLLHNYINQLYPYFYFLVGLFFLTNQIFHLLYLNFLKLQFINHTFQYLSLLHEYLTIHLNSF